MSKTKKEFRETINSFKHSKGEWLRYLWQLTEEKTTELFKNLSFDIASNKEVYERITENVFQKIYVKIFSSEDIDNNGLVKFIPSIKDTDKVNFKNITVELDTAMINYTLESYINPIKEFISFSIGKDENFNNTLKYAKHGKKLSGRGTSKDNEKKYKEILKIWEQNKVLYKGDKTKSKLMYAIRVYDQIHKMKWTEKEFKYEHRAISKYIDSL